MTSRYNSALGALLLSCTVLTYTTAQAEMSDNVIKIGVMSDQSGPYSDNIGPGAVEAARMAVEAFGGEINGAKIELVIADDQNKPDIGVSIAQKWVETEGVDAIVGGSASSIALAIQKVMAERQKPYMIAGSASSALTNEACSPYGTFWVMDTYGTSKGIVNSMLAQGNDTFYFITVDYNFGKALQADATRFIEEGGGKVLGSSVHPLNATDFSSQLLQAQASGAKVIVMANAGNDFANAMKQAQEFGIVSGGQKVVTMLMSLNGTHSIGLQNLQGMSIVTTSYWDINDETRAFAEVYRKRFRDRTPNEAATGTYSAVHHYLTAVQMADTDDGPTIAKKMREIPVNDFQLKNVHIREDGQVMRPMLTVTIKNKDESKGPYDYYTVTGSLRPEDVWRPVSESACSFIKS